MTNWITAAREAGATVEERSKGAKLGRSLGNYMLASMTESELTAFAEAVLEMAAVKCEERAATWDGNPPDGQEREWNWMRDEANYCASAIRSMKGPGDGSTTA